jgi:hypothetical protein
MYTLQKDHQMNIHAKFDFNYPIYFGGVWNMKSLQKTIENGHKGTMAYKSEVKKKRILKIDHDT